MEPGPGINKLGKRIAPGFWEDADGNGHVSITELMEMFEIEDTPENHEQIKKMLVEMLSNKNNPNQKIIFRTSPDDKGAVIK